MGYILVIANIGFTILSIPLALRYLGKEEFGLWAIAQQINSYFLLIDLGLSSAMSRLLANHKDNVNGELYGSLLTTGGFVFVIQGGVLAGFGSLFAFAAPSLFNIPNGLANDFRNVLIILCFLSGTTIALRSITAPLWAFQRLDISYSFGVISLVGGLAGLWLGFRAGWGVYSFAFAGIPPLVVCTVLGFAFCRRHSLYPAHGCWTGPRWAAFQEMFALGKDVMLMSIGSQLVNASQIMILGRFAGLETAATFSIGTKFYALGIQVTGRLFDSSAPALTEMFVQRDHGRLQHRFNDILRISLFLATSGAVALLAANTAVVGWWTSDVIQWRFRWDIFLGLLLVATTASRCLVGLFGITGNLRPVRNLYLLEAAVFILTGVPATASFGISGLLVASIGAHLLVTAFFSTMAARNIIGSLRAMRRPVLLATAIFAGAASISALLQTAQTPLAYAGSAIVIFGFTAVAAAAILPPDAKSRFFGKVVGFTGALRK
jgi:O-antigen/teichoic acid export membrane protein